VFDPLIANPGRLRILTALAGEESAAAEFVRLRDGTGLTDGNLATHARRLSSAGLLAIHKSFRADGKPVTTLCLTPRGRQALHDHVRSLITALNLRPAAAAIAPISLAEPQAELVPVSVASDQSDADAADDWVD
jgi:DNA-binding MarR family transcriptional regulator